MKNDFVSPPYDDTLSEVVWPTGPSLPPAHDAERAPRHET